MISQASEFRGLVQSMGDEVELNIMGDGLLAHMVQTGADNRGSGRGGVMFGRLPILAS